MTITQERKIDRLIKLTEKLLESNTLKAAEWVTYEEAKKIHNRSKDWYRIRRRTILREGEDWRSDGYTIWYKVEAIERLKIAQ